MKEIKENIFSKEFVEENFKGIVALNIAVNGCVFESCKFENCNFSSVELKDSSFLDCEFINCKIMGIDWSYINQAMGFQNVFKKCDLRYSVFINNDLKGMEMYDCDLKESSFEHCNMHKCVFKKCDFELARFVKNDLRECDFRESFNYAFDIIENRCEKAKFDSPEVLELLRVRGIKVD